MSLVGLPQVNSARTAGSGRQSLQSAGSTASRASHYSHSGLGSASDDDWDEDDGGQDDDEEEGGTGNDSDEPHENTSELWEEVETFLTKPSPSFAALAKQDTKHAQNVLPSLRNERQPVAPSGNQGRGSGRTSRQSNQNKFANKPIDPKLLQEAFAYAERLQRMNLDDDNEEDQQTEAAAGAKRVGILRRDGSGPRLASDAVRKQVGGGSGRIKPDDTVADVTKKKKKAATTRTSAYGAPVKPQKKKNSVRASSRDGSEWDSSPSTTCIGGDGHVDPSGSSQRRVSGSISVMDAQTMQTLVSNFQNGTTLEELRKELAVSQQSLAQSRQVIQEAAKTFFHNKK